MSEIIEAKVGELYRKCYVWLVSDFWSNFIFLHTYMIQLDYIYSVKSLKFFTTLLSNSATEKSS